MIKRSETLNLSFEDVDFKLDLQLKHFDFIGNYLACLSVTPNYAIAMSVYFPKNDVNTKAKF